MQKYQKDKKAFKLTTTIVAALLFSYSPLIVLRIIFKKNYQVILLNDKIAIIVNLQYRKGFLYWCRKEKEWKYYIILSHSM